MMNTLAFSEAIEAKDQKKFASAIIPQGPQLREHLFSDRTYRIGSENAFRIDPQIRELELQGYKVIKCNLGEPDFPLAKQISNEIKRQIDFDLTHYCDPQGILPLREAIARIVSRTRRIAISPDRIVVFPGGKSPIGLTQQTYCNPGDEVIYPSPGFPIYESFTGYVGAKPVPLDREQSSPSTLVQMFLLWRYQVATMDRRSFGSIGSEGQHYLRISIATALDDLKIGLERIRKAATDIDGFQNFIKEGKHVC